MKASSIAAVLLALLPAAFGQGEKIVIIGGGARPSALVEILDAPSVDDAGTGRECDRAPNYPILEQGSVGEVIQNRIVVCGGRNPDTQEPLNGCFDLNPQQNLWQPFPPMGLARAFAAGVLLPDGRFWVTGGVTPDGATETTEVFDPVTREWSRGPDLPRPVSSHCLVPVGNNDYLLAGGSGTDNEPYYSETDLFDFDSGEWTRKNGTLLIPRSEAACGVYIYDDQTLHVFLVGGTEPDVEQYDFAADQWFRAEETPISINGGSIVHDGADMVLTGGDAQPFERYRGNGWEVLDYGMEEPERKWSTVVLAPISSLSNCRPPQ